jgi:hypothetical protein
LPADELIEHVLQAGEAGRVIQAEWLLTPQQIQRLSEIILHQDVHDARAVVNACEGQIGEQLVRIYLKSRQSPADDRQ